MEVLIKDIHPAGQGSFLCEKTPALTCAVTNALLALSVKQSFYTSCLMLNAFEFCDYLTVALFIHIYTIPFAVQQFDETKLMTDQQGFEEIFYGGQLTEN